MFGATSNETEKTIKVFGGNIFFSMNITESKKKDVHFQLKSSISKPRGFFSL